MPSLPCSPPGFTETGYNFPALLGVSVTPRLGVLISSGALLHWGHLSVNDRFFCDSFSSVASCIAWNLVRIPSLES